MSLIFVFIFFILIYPALTIAAFFIALITTGIIYSKNKQTFIVDKKRLQFKHTIFKHLQFKILVSHIESLEFRRSSSPQQFKLILNLKNKRRILLYVDTNQDRVIRMEQMINNVINAKSKYVESAKAISESKKAIIDEDVEFENKLKELSRTGKPSVNFPFTIKKSLIKLEIIYHPKYHLNNYLVLFFGVFSLILIFVLSQDDPSLSLFYFSPISILFMIWGSSMLLNTHIEVTSKLFYYKKGAFFSKKKEFPVSSIKRIKIEWSQNKEASTYTLVINTPNVSVFPLLDYPRKKVLEIIQKEIKSFIESQKS